MIKNLIHTLIILFVGSLLFSACGRNEKPVLKLGDSAPNFTLQDLKGQSFSLQSLQGKPVVIRFFVPNCKYCRADTAIFNDYYQKYKNKGLHVVYINTDRSGADISKFVEELKIRFPVANDTDGKVADLYRVQVVPQTIVLSPAHSLQGAILGGVSEAELDELLKEYL